MDYWTIVFTGLAVLFTFYYFCVRNLDFFKKHGIIHVRPVPLIGNMWPSLSRQKSAAEIISDLYNLHPEAKYVGFFDIMNPVVVIRDVELIKTIGVKNFESFPDHRGFVDGNVDPLFGKNLFSLRSDRWRNIRTLLSPAFSSSKMKAMFKLMSTCAADFSQYLTKLPEEQKTMEMKDCYTRYTNDVIATCAFGVSIDSMRNPNNDFYLYGRDVTSFAFSSIKFLIARSLPVFSRLAGIRIVPVHVANFFKDLVSTTIRTREEKGIVRPDMMQLMIESKGKQGAGKELTIEDMTSQAFIFFFGGFDTTSSLMCFATHEIAVNPDIQEKLQNEIDKVLEESNGELTYESINGMQYLDAVINEALRIYPAAVFTDRVCSKEFELPPALPSGKPFLLKKGMAVWFPVYGLHHDPKYFEDPETFNPDRWVEQGKKLSNNGAYIPFGLGPRMCIGNRFALLETKVLLFHLLARCNLKPCEKTAKQLKFSKTGLSLMAEGGFWLKVVPRSNPHPSVFNVKVNDNVANDVTNDVAKDVANGIANRITVPS